MKLINNLRKNRCFSLQGDGYLTKENKETQVLLKWSPKYWDITLKEKLTQLKQSQEYFSSITKNVWIKRKEDSYKFQKYT